jgi:peptidoglycan endopeptidase LytE
MNDKQTKLLEIARSLSGVPYKYAVPLSEIPQYLDCSSYTQYVFGKIGIELPRSTIAQATIGQNITDAMDKKAYSTGGREISSRNDLEIGDLIFFRSDKGHYNDAWFSGKQISIGHAVIFIGDNKVIHAASINKKVAEEDLDHLIGHEGPIVMIKRVL